MRVARLVADGAIAAAFLPVLLVRALVVRRRRPRQRPRILWGVTPIINLKYWSAAASLRGYDSKTVVVGVYAINRPTDFDVVLERGGIRGLVRVYAAFARELEREVHVLFFDGGLLANTVLARLEGSLLKLAGRKLVLVPYGSDIAGPGTLGPLESLIHVEYPLVIERAQATRRRVERLSRAADVVVRNVQPGYLPRSSVYDRFRYS